MTDAYDVIVVGAGPAGSTAAIAARRAGASVLLLDKADFPRDKACGDGVAPHALDVLESLGVTGVADGYKPVLGLKLETPRSEAGGGLIRPDHTIPRYVFDARLVEAAVAAGAELRRHTVRTIAQADDGVVLDDSLRAPVVIGADGAGSVVRRALGHAPNRDRHMALAIRGYVTVRRARRAAHRHLRAALAGVRLGVPDRRRPGQRRLRRGAARPDAQPRAPAPAARRAAARGGPAGGRPACAPTTCRCPPSRPSPGTGRVLLAGDALSLINPFTGEGIFYAVLSGALAGAAAAATPEAAARPYAAALRRRLGRHLRHSAAAAWLARRPSVIEAAVRAAGRDRGVFDSIVELGLGDGLLEPRTLGHIARALAVRS